jgi:hypothetical protein
MTDKLEITQEELEDFKQSVIKQVLDSLKQENENEKFVKEAKLKEETKVYEQYTNTMKESDNPWVDIKGWATDEHGVKVELDWNESFVNYLKENGITGTSDEEIVQKWITYLMNDMSAKLNPTEAETDSKYE